MRLLDVYPKITLVALAAMSAVSCSSSSSAIVDPGDGGGPSKDGGGGGSTTADQACQDLAAAACQKINQCNPWYLQSVYGDVDTCKSRYIATGCTNYLGLMNSSDTPASYEACVSALNAATCQQWLDNEAALAVCLPKPGMLAAGATCGTSAQCQTANCNFTSGASCGTCGPQSGAGGQCQTSNQCTGSLLCINGLCGTPGSAGDNCSSTAPCKNSLICTSSRCAIPPKAGEACTVGTLPCDGHAGLICRNSVCQSIQYVMKGQPCNPSQGRECAQSGFCKGATTTSDGTCLAFAADGAACDDMAGSLCVPFATCVGGFCKVDDPRACR